MELATGELGRKLLQAQQNALLKQESINLHQLLWVVHQWYLTEADAGALFDPEDLQEVKLISDRFLDKFDAVWEHVLTGMEDKRPPEGTLRTMYLRQLRTCAVFNYDIQHYDRLPLDHPDKSYEYLRRCVRNCARARSETRSPVPLAMPRLHPRRCPTKVILPRTT